jgi:ABC-2 type transport system ATP-binding protein
VGIDRGDTGLWDAIRTRGRLDALGIPIKRKVGKLSGGQQAQVALASR